MYKLCTYSYFSHLSTLNVQNMYNRKSATKRSGAVSFLYVCTYVCTNTLTVTPCNQKALFGATSSFIDSLILWFSDSIYPSNYLSILPANTPVKSFNHTSEVFTLCKTK